jgi:hypothetical protein
VFSFAQHPRYPPWLSALHGNRFALAARRREAPAQRWQRWNFVTFHALSRWRSLLEI